MTPIRLRPVSALLLGALALSASGCGSLGVALHGTVRSDLVDAQGSSAERPLVLAFDRLGNLTINGQALDLPGAREQVRFGVGLVEADALPPVWRPAHAGEGGVLVASVVKASPLAVAGLRPFDRIDAVDGEPVHGAEDAAARLDVAPGEEVRLAVTRPDGARAEVAAAPAERVLDNQRIRVPFLFERHAAETGHSFGFGPLDGLFYYRARTDHGYVAEDARARSAFFGRFEWGTFFNLVYYERARDVTTGAEESRLRLFWLLSFGDDEVGP